MGSQMLEEGSACAALVLAPFLRTHCSAPQGMERWIRWTLGLINMAAFVLPRSGMLGPSSGVNDLLF